MVEDSDFVQAVGNVAERVAQANVSEQIGLSAREKAMLRRKKRHSDAFDSTPNMASSNSNQSPVVLREIETISERLEEIFKAVGGENNTKIIEQDDKIITDKISAVDNNDTQLVIETRPASNSLYWGALNEWPFGAVFDRLVIDLFE